MIKMCYTLIMDSGKSREKIDFTDKQIKITCDGTDYIDFRKLIPFQENLKTLTDENLNKLKQSIIKYGFTVPAFVWENNNNKYILDAHQRQKALQSLFSDGYSIPDIPVVYIQAADRKEAKEKLLHISSQYGKFDQEGLQIFCEDIILEDSIRLVDTELNISEKIETIEDDEVSETEKNITRLGDLWGLGNHRVLCGDSTNIETVEKLMNKKKVDMVFTDPPFDFKKTEWFYNIQKYIIGHLFIYGSERLLIPFLFDDNFSRLFAVDFRNGILISNKGPITKTDFIAEFRKGSNRFINKKDGFSTLIEMPKIKSHQNQNLGCPHQKKVELVEIFINHYTRK